MNIKIISVAKCNFKLSLIAIITVHNFLKNFKNDEIFLDDFWKKWSTEHLKK
jgi:hypothetical protein